MELMKTAIPDVVVINSVRHSDDRGFFAETFRADWFRANVADIDFVQDNHSKSTKSGTLRGLHFQIPPHAQAKLVRCVAGKILDVAVDLRQSSSTYGQWITAELSSENGDQLFVPVGFAHGFVTLEEDTEVIYKVSDYYSADCDRGLMWDDQELGVDWGPGHGKLTVSTKDCQHPKLADFENPFR